MPPATDPSRSISIHQLISTLDARAGHESCALAFDGDGTLWAGDVSDDVFLAACANDWLLPDVRPNLAEILERHAQPADGSASELALRIFQSEKLGVIEERLLFEVMTWCYAGRTERELSEFADRILNGAGIEERVRQGYRPLLEWAQTDGHSCWLVTASPWPIVRVAARRLGFVDGQILAARAPVAPSGVLEIGLTAPLPYRDQKVHRLAEKLESGRLLAAFGDSHFDIDMLREAEVPVAVNPKPALELLLQTIPQAVLLEF